MGRRLPRTQLERVPEGPAIMTRRAALRLVLSSPLRWATCACLALLFLGSAGAATETPIRSIDIAQTSDGFVADVVMFAPVPASVAWDVLTDFDHQAAWVPNVRESKVIARDGNAMTVEQHGVAKFGLASFSYVSVRQVQIDPQRTVHSTQVKGDSTKRLESLMTLKPDGGGTQLNYHLEIVPAGLAALAVSKDTLDRQLRDQFTAIIEEMGRRVR
jgi:hypothetical protein